MGHSGSSRRLARLVAVAVGLALVATPASAQAKKVTGGGNPPPTTTPAASSFAGRAYALDANLTLLSGQIHVGPISDTGQLPAGGGYQSAQLLGLNNPAPLLISAGILTAATAGSGDLAASFASVADAHVNLDNLLDVRAGLLQSEATAQCVNGAPVYHGTSNIAYLAISGGGKSFSLPLSASPNTQLSIPGLATIWVNHQYVSNGRLVVNALEVHVGGVLAGLVTADVIVSHAEAGVTCTSGGGNPPPCSVSDFVTGGGQFAVPGGDASFGMNGGVKPNGLSGHFTMVNHATKGKISGDAVTSYTVTGPNSRRLLYTNSAGDQIQVDVTDNGEPGTSDTIQVTLNGVVQGGGTLEHGNIQLHHPNGCTS